jgi:hypothetical protein
MGRSIESRLGKLEAGTATNDEPISVICFDRGDVPPGEPITATVAGQTLDCRNLPDGFTPYWIVFLRDDRGPA